MVTDYVKTATKGRVSNRTAIARGYVSELVVVADLAARCGNAYMNPQPQTPHDAFVKTSAGWMTIQIKTAGVSTKTGRIFTTNGGPRIKSDLLAFVDLLGRRVRYTGAVRPVPPELDGTFNLLGSFADRNNAMEEEIRGFEAWHKNPNN